MTPPVAVFSGDQRVDGVSPLDRGLAYGDGVFETMRAHRGAVPWWAAHWERLVLGAGRLGLPLPPGALVHDETMRLLDGGDAVLKLVLTRGDGTRGYAPASTTAPTWVLSTHPLPAPVRAGGLVVRWCETRLAHQPLLAGLKHCNRLEQVLARGEWPAPGEAGGDAFDEGLVCDTEDSVVGATAANVLVFGDGGWRTPPVDRCGVAGTCRAWSLREAGVVERRLSRVDIESADAVVLCNAVRGILPVARLGARAWPPHPAVAALSRQLAAAHPAFAGPGTTLGES